MPYHYPTPEQPPSPESPWSGLSDEARDSLTSSVLGTNAASILLPQEVETSDHGEFARDFRSSLEQAHDSASRLFGLHNETPPSLNDPELKEKVERLEKLYEQYEALGLEPEVVLVLEHQPLSWWMEIDKAMQNNAFNTSCVGNPASKFRKNSDISVDDRIQENWEIMTNPNSLPPTWMLNIISGSDQPTVTNVTSYGYTDKNNQITNPQMNRMLEKIGLPPVPDPTPAVISMPRVRKLYKKAKPQAILPLAPSKIQSMLHPSIETYLAAQYSRIVQNKEPMDKDTWSWLGGELPTSLVQRGYWNSYFGCVVLKSDSATNLYEQVGWRPSRGSIT